MEAHGRLADCEVRSDESIAARLGTLATLSHYRRDTVRNNFSTMRNNFSVDVNIDGKTTNYLSESHTSANAFQEILL